MTEYERYERMARDIGSPNGDGHTPPGGDPQASRCGFKYAPIDSAELDAGDFRPTFLIKNLLVAAQPHVIVGGSKTMKTTLGIDGAISMASGESCLTTFDVPCAVPGVFISGESGKHTIQETARRVCKAKGRNLADLGDMLLWQFRLPQLALPDELDELKRGLDNGKRKFCFIDPLYLALLAGSVGVDAANMYQMGPLLLNISTACLDVGCTPTLLHHTNRSGARKNEPLELSDIAYSGVPEFARQWWLVSRRTPYDPGSGEHELFLSVGGSVGHGGLWNLDIHEGRLGDDFTGRTWDVEVTTATIAKQTKASERDREKQIQLDGDEMTVAGIIDKLNADGWATKTRIRDGCGLPRQRCDGAIERLCLGKLFHRTTVEIERANGRKMKAEAYRRTGTPETPAAEVPAEIAEVGNLCG